MCRPGTNSLHSLCFPSAAQESSEDVSGGLPFLVDLALGLSVLACSMLRILYNGPEITKDEETCQELLRSKLLQRWGAQTGRGWEGGGQPQIHRQKRSLLFAAGGYLKGSCIFPSVNDSTTPSCFLEQKGQAVPCVVSSFQMPVASGSQWRDLPGPHAQPFPAASHH